MPYVLHIRPKGEADVRRITDRIARTVSPFSAAKWHDGILARIQTLADDPRVWPDADEAHQLGLDLRLLPFGRGRHQYRILFTVTGDTINVLRILHAAQDYITDDDL